MPIIYSVLQGFVAYFRISSEPAQDSPGLPQDLRQTPPGRPQDAPGLPQDAPGTSETNGFLSSGKALQTWVQTGQEKKLIFQDVRDGSNSTIQL